MKKEFFYVEVAESHLPAVWMAAKRTSLEQGEIAPFFHYATARQANLWMALFRRYSPFSQEEGRGLYSRAAKESVATLCERPGQLVSLGCGTAEKESLVYDALLGRSWKADWVCIDGSLSLLLEADRLARSRGEGVRLVLADIVVPDLLDRLLPEGAVSRLITAFGLIPNLRPDTFLEKLRVQVARQDRLLLGVNLAPAPEESPESYRASAEEILPQYANRSTRLWLTELLRDWGLREMVESYEVKGVENEGWIRFEATVRWKRDREILLEDGSSVAVQRGSSLRLFSSYRFTREGFARLLRATGFEPVASWTVSSGEEGVWLAAPSDSCSKPTV
ncbi:hypothetical protein MAMC_00580 [Methylacidimicrobium cyclopophantes]|uniref:Histidine-specific methyltransferase SAM-dependent domain-containing protein n=1 Tax=Methylacidimicrobium cyclopophantes TaxID=1041766 RepID=A0A5E6M876_9BACT|nr:L-histidine N(alpha)-methyltransferase [Methylacidimicrobium cyclopophantes]VVM05437.1 hypothetical protein MAMC_00580 [Methylacidimicrobium cyclopophantes]